MDMVNTPCDMCKGCIDGNRVISVSPCTLSKEYRDMDCDLRDCAECRKEFWLKEVE